MSTLVLYSYFFSPLGVYTAPFLMMIVVGATASLVLKEPNPNLDSAVAQVTDRLSTVYHWLRDEPV